uniref:Insulin-like protein peptide 2 n=1 Tax=Triatoma infestans TaxID=30076 RepID=A0A170ZUE4_TRIIF
MEIRSSYHLLVVNNSDYERTAEKKISFTGKKQIWS